MLNHTVRAVMAANSGLLTTDQARDAGLTAGDLRLLLRQGQLVALRRGVYVDGELWCSLDEYRGQHRLRTRAAIRTMRRGYVISHDSAAHELELDILLPPVPHVHITRPGSTNAWTEYGVKHHYARYRPSQVVDGDELRVLEIARTAVDIARDLGEPYGEIACDSALRKGVSRAALEAAIEPMVSWPYVQRARRAIDFANPGAQTLAETLGRILVEELGLKGEIDTQFPARLADGRVVWGDIRVGCHVFEFDGEIKYKTPAEGGVADQPPHKVVWAEKKRDRLLWDVGLGTSHIIWQDFWVPYRAAAIKRLKAEYADTVAHFGEQLPERLVRQAVELRAERLA